MKNSMFLILFVLLTACGKNVNRPDNIVPPTLNPPTNGGVEVPVPVPAAPTNSGNRTLPFANNSDISSGLYETSVVFSERQLVNFSNTISSYSFDAVDKGVYTISLEFNGQIICQYGFDNTSGKFNALSGCANQMVQIQVGDVVTLQNIPPQQMALLSIGYTKN